MQNLADMLWRRRWIVAAVLVIAVLLSPMILSLIRPTFEAEADIALVQDDSGRKPVLQAADLPAVVMSIPVVERVREQLDVPLSLGAMRGHISAKPDTKSAVLPIQYRDKDRVRALKVTNALADALIVYYRDLATRQYRDLNVSLRAQLAVQGQKVRDLDTRIAKAVQDNSVAASPNASNSVVGRIAALDAERGSVYANLLAEQAGADREQGSGELAPAIAAQAAASDPYYGALRAGEAKDAAEYQFQKAGYTDQYPGLAGLQEKVSLESAAVNNARKKAEVAQQGSSSLLTQLLLDKRRSATLIAADQARVRAIDSQISQAQGRLSGLSTAGVSADALRLQRGAASAAYQSLFLKLQQSMAAEAEASTLSSLMVLNYALEAHPHIPRIALELIVALLILGAAIGSAYAAEALDPRIRTATDVENVYGASRIGSIR